LHGGQRARCERQADERAAHIARADAEYEEEFKGSRGYGYCAAGLFAGLDAPGLEHEALADDGGDEEATDAAAQQDELFVAVTADQCDPPCPKGQICKAGECQKILAPSGQEVGVKAKVCDPPCKSGTVCVRENPRKCRKPGGTGVAGGTIGAGSRKAKTRAITSCFPGEKCYEDVCAGKGYWSNKNWKRGLKRQISGQLNHIMDADGRPKKGYEKHYLYQTKRRLAAVTGRKYGKKWAKNYIFSLFNQKLFGTNTAYYGAPSLRVAEIAKFFRRDVKTEPDVKQAFQSMCKGTLEVSVTRKKEIFILLSKHRSEKNKEKFDKLLKGLK